MRRLARHRHRLGWLLTLALAMTLAPALSQARLPAAAGEPGPGPGVRVDLNTARTTISFTVGATFHQVEGTARLLTGHLLLDPASGAAGGRFEVDAASAATGNDGRDAKMHEKVLLSPKFGLMVFHPSRVEGMLDLEGGSRLRVEGMLDIHGDSHPVAMLTEVKVEAGHLSGVASFSIPYVDWGMKDPSVFMFRVHKEVQVVIHLDGSLVVDGGGEAP